MLCSFCGRTKEEVHVLITGPGVNICDKCVGACAQTILERRYVAQLKRNLAALPSILWKELWESVQWP